MKHLLLPAQVGKGCFRQRLTESVLVPLKYKEATYLLIVCVLLDVCNAPFIELKWEEIDHLVNAAVKISHEKTFVHFLTTVDTVFSPAPLCLQIQ